MGSSWHVFYVNDLTVDIIVHETGITGTPKSLTFRKDKL